MSKILSIILFLCLLGVFGLFVVKKEPEEASKKQYANGHYASYSNSEFYAHLGKTATSLISEKVFGGIVSHHFYAEKEISAFFDAMRTQRPRVVVLIGPDHFSAGGHDILVSRYPYQTPWGALEPEENIIDRLIARDSAVREELPFEHEHSIATLTGFIKNAFPEAKLVPIMLKRTTSAEKLDKLAQQLIEMLPEDSLVLGSIDFSHHQNRFAAAFHDAKSIAVMKSFSFSEISRLEIDSPPTLYAVLKYMDARAAHRVAYATTNSTVISGSPDSEDVTSYLFAHFLSGPLIPDPAVSVLSFGDVMLGRSVKPMVANGKNPFEKIKGVEGNFFRGQDAITANLEGPITDTPVCQKKEIVFNFPKESGKLLFDNHIKIVNFANNHSFDCFLQGIQDTAHNLTAAGVDYFGAPEIGKRFTIKKIGTKTLAFYGVNLLWTPEDDLGSIMEEVKTLKQKYDYVIVNVHWGVEYNRGVSEYQKKAGHLFIDNGADLVIGHHPHVVEPVEIYNGKPIFYSLGNFVFDQPFPGTKEGVGVGSVFKESGNEFYIFPYTINAYQPVLMPYDQAVTFCQTFLAHMPNSNDGCMFTGK